jgi:probable rRNA maturation factor
VNRVQISADEIPLPRWSKSLKSYALKVLDQIGRDKWDLSVLLCDDKTISALNSRYRGKAEATDVLSFSLEPPCKEAAPSDVFPVKGSRYMPGDIVISLDTLRENACRFKIDEDEELRRLLIHGILHLDGMDHRSNGKNEPMIQIQEKILEQLGDEHIVESNA